MQGYLVELEQKALQEISSARTSKELENLRIKYLGRKNGEITKLMSDLPNLSLDEKRTVGPLLNQVKANIEEAIKESLGISSARNQVISPDPVVLRTKVLAPTISVGGKISLPLDVTAPGLEFPVGKLHPTTLAFYEIIEIFKELGFSYAEGPEVEWFWYAFEALNMPATHPAADDFETFYIEARSHPEKGRMLLRPHNSSVQIRVMEGAEPPLRIIAPGKSYRPNYDASHTPMFYQFEGLMIDQDLSIGNLKAVLSHFVQRFFGDDIKIRFRPHHFNFTEPSFEVDITCTVCKGSGCALCKKSGWLELGGAGMVHPNVFKNVGIDPKSWSGFAWGWGIERCLAIRHQIPDIRILYENDLRVLRSL